MNEKDQAQLDAIESVLDLTGEDDWPLLHNTVRKYVAEGRLSKEAEAIYKNMVDKKLQERNPNANQ